MIRQKLTAPVSATTFTLTASSTFNGSVTNISVTKIVDLPAVAAMSNATNVALPWYKSAPDFITPEMCGAIGSGDDFDAAADQAALSAAWDWMRLAKIPILLGPKTYVLTGYSTRGALHSYHGDFVDIRGHGERSKLKMAGSGAADNYQTIIGLQGGRNIFFSNFQLDGNLANVNTASGNGILAYNNNEYHPIERMRLDNMIITGTTGYGLGLANIPIFDFASFGLRIINVGNDGIDIKPYNEPANTLPKEGLHFVSTYIENHGVLATGKAAFDCRGHTLIEGLTVRRLRNHTGSGETVGLRLNADADENESRKGARQSQISNVRIEYDHNGPAQTTSNRAVGVGIYDEFVNIDNLLIDGCHLGIEISPIGAGDSPPVGVNFGNTHVLNARGSDGQGVGISISSSGTKATHFGRAVIDNCDLGFSANSTVSGTIRLSGCTKGQTLSTTITDGSPSSTVEYDGNTTNADNPGGTAILRARNTKNGTWVAGEVMGGCEFKVDDPSGVGSGYPCCGTGSCARGNRWSDIYCLVCVSWQPRRRKSSK